jgi:hypothetical protein
LFFSVVSIPVRNIETNRKKKLLGFAKKQTEKQPKQIEFRFEPRKKINGFEYPLIDNVFFGIFLVCFGLFRENSVCFGCFDTGPKHRNKPKKCFLVSRNKPKNNRNRLSFGLFWFGPKKIFDCFEDTLPPPHPENLSCATRKWPLCSGPLNQEIQIQEMQPTG